MYRFSRVMISTVVVSWKERTGMGPVVCSTHLDRHISSVQRRWTANNNRQSAGVEASGPISRVSTKGPGIWCPRSGCISSINSTSVFLVRKRSYGQRPSALAVMSTRAKKVRCPQS